jgi:uncharacterized protein YkwD
MWVECPVKKRLSLSCICLLLLVLAGAVLVQTLFLHPAPAPVAANTSAVPSPAAITEAPEPAGTIPPAATGSSPGVPVINTSSLEARVHELVNRVRQENNLPALGTDAALVSLARAHSRDMALHGYFGHVNLHGMDPTARGAAAGYTCYRDKDSYYTHAIAENLFATYRNTTIIMVGGRVAASDRNTEEAIAEMTIDAWMNSPDHRDNILDPHMGREGIGAAVSKNDLVFITEDFC